MADDYQYKVEEKSLTQTYLIKFIWQPIVQKIPASFTPNMISVTGAVFMFFSIFFIRLAIQGQVWGYLGAAFCVLIYMVADNIDGIHARATGQSSRLGEFLDHWLDSLNMVVVNMCVILSLGFNDWLLIILAIGMAMAFFATIWEHHHTGIFQSGRLGTNEGLLMIVGLFVLLFFLPKNEYLLYGGPYKLSLASVFAYTTIVVCAITVGSCMWRVRAHFKDYLAIFIAIASMVVLAYKGFDKRLATMGILIADVLFSGPFLIERLTDKVSKFRNGIIAGVALTIIAWAFFAPTSLQAILHNDNYLYAIGFVLLLPVVWDVKRAVSSLS